MNGHRCCSSGVEEPGSSGALEPLIQPKGNLIEQRHRGDGGMEGVEHQVAGLRHHHRGQHQSQLTSFAEPPATEGCAGAAVGNGIPARREIAGIGAAMP